MVRICDLSTQDCQNVTNRFDKVTLIVSEFNPFKPSGAKWLHAIAFTGLIYQFKKKFTFEHCGAQA